MKRKRRSYYDGSLKKLPSGRWRMQISLGQSEDGTRKRLSKTFDTQKDAIDWKNKMYTIKENYGQDICSETVISMAASSLLASSVASFSSFSNVFL